MGKFKEDLSKNLITYIVTFVIAFLLGATIFLLWFFLNNRTLFDAVNASTMSFVIILVLGLFMWLNSVGTFDGIVYGFKQLFAGAFASKANKYNDYPGYVQHKKEVRSSGPRLYLAFIFASLIFGIALIVLELIYHIKY